MRFKSFAIILLVSILVGSVAFAYKYITEDKYLQTNFYSANQKENVNLNTLDSKSNNSKTITSEERPLSETEQNYVSSTPEPSTPEKVLEKHNKDLDNDPNISQFILNFVNRPERDKLFGSPVAFSKKVLGSNPSSGKEVALTFDDGPFPIYTEKYVDILKSMDVKATFFVIGKHAEKHPELLKYIVENGNEIGLHSYSHFNMKKLKPEKMVEELYKTQQIIVEATGIKPTLFRPPFGAYNSTLIEISNALGLKVVLWNVDPDDWRNPSVESVVNRVLSHTRDGSIILMHEGKPSTLAALPQIIKKLKEEGYKFVTVSELLEKRD
ncbi:polysaccharide deacetylase family sporulation protein PdaB [Caldanaerobacter subterraneus subsp. tengcongensis MB4]|uniref:Predicted xylanase/chitin deacetylase n=3 Tax=Caldanaerobacter subterraneus TaxID=911092 RepID=Q8RBF4_CALS4|nr:polysaccharide deacetylase family sporulation protein PdaB [Caldanaerobacter subterraneus]AAM24122.1 predicted xylanase/chitin deacetylase [Caldanaerobacter subterraneus subsp. tengcongensis MB4]ERM92986.1 polysaccharide deacetylase [Caldanaerobacter subterraneus subsp. yonseiensis KB-1]KKC30048.1 Acetylxylan esterase [Caldanaerobacter subterraneus subsp. pacificus DSM 12653]MBE3579861.1 polysaccharide deacetylase family sporulation protein PdaB [Caldanaerobacter subterraneus]MCS3916355.1 p